MCTPKPRPSTKPDSLACCAERAAGITGELASLLHLHLRLRAWLLAGCLLLCGLGPAWAETVAQSVNNATRQFSSATAYALNDGHAPTPLGEVRLPHRWDRLSPRPTSGLLYRLTLPPGDGRPQALHLLRAGNQVEIRVNGEVLAMLGELGNPRLDAAKNNWLVNVPAALLSTTGPNVLELRITAQPDRYGGLWPVEYGPVASTTAAYNRLNFWKHTVQVWLSAGWLLIGLAAAALWAQQRVPLYGWFALAACLGVARHVDRLWPDPPVPWGLWAWLIAVAYGLHLLFMLHVVVSLMHATPPVRMRRLMLATGAVMVALATVAFVFSMPQAWTAALLVLLVFSLCVLWVTVRAARTAPLVWRVVLWTAVLVSLACAVHDLGFVRIGARTDSAIRISLMPFVAFGMALLMGGVIVVRYNAVVRAYQHLNNDLKVRVDEKERELKSTLEIVHQQKQAHALSEERQRIMRELHDGVGSQLVGLLNLASKGVTDPALIEEHVKLALDEMRMAVDSLQPVHNDLAIVLATLRYRVQARLEATGITVQWDVPNLPTLRNLTPQVALQVQRILLECLTNVLKHSRATVLRVHAEWIDTAPTRVLIEVSDNGVGIAADLAQKGLRGGLGLENMQTRATAIGATLFVGPAAPNGTMVRLAWPAQAA